MIVSDEDDELNGKVSRSRRRRELEALSRKDSRPRYAFNRFNRQNSDIRVASAMLQLMRKHPQAASIFYFMVCISNNSNYVNLSDSEIAELLDIPRPSASKNLKLLTDYGFIAKTKTGHMNAYFVNEQICWKSSGQYHDARIRDLREHDVRFSNLKVDGQDKSMVAIRKAKNRTSKGLPWLQQDEETE